MITVIGEALVDLVTRTGSDTVAHPGGSPANVAVALARLEAPVTLMTRIGRDDYGRLLLDHLTGNGVVVGDIEDDLPTSKADAHLDESGAATYVFQILWDLPDAQLPVETICLHTGSIAAVLEPGASAVRDLVANSRNKVTLTYDPNCRPTLMGDPAEARKNIEALLSTVHVVKVSDEDLAWLYPGETDAQSARRWLSIGPSVVVVTRGGEGVFGVARSGELARPALAVDVVDTVGAGDSFMAGLLDGLWRRDLLGAPALPRLAAIGSETLGEIVDEALLVSAITVSRAGANPPTRAELQAMRP